MQHAKSILLIVFFMPLIAIGQFGPKKKDLQSRIDTLGMTIDFQQFEINNLKIRDSITSSEIKRLSNELKDLKNYTIDLNSNIEKLRLENESFRRIMVNLKNNMKNW